MFDTILGNANSYFAEMLPASQTQSLLHDNTKGGVATAIIYYVGLTFIVFLIVSNLFVNVTGDVYNQCRSSSLQTWSDAVDELMIEYEWRRVRGFPDRDPFLKLLQQVFAFLKRISCRLSPSARIRPEVPEKREEGKTVDTSDSTFLDQLLALAEANTHSNWRG